MYSYKTRQRFWSHVKKTDTCWLWTAGKAKGYGHFHFGKTSDKTRQTIKAHRYSWALKNGEIKNGLQVCHKCDVPLCVRPDHLFLGTHDENHRDKVLKGRSPAGIKNGRATFSEEDIKRIRALRAEGKMHKEICAIYGAKQAIISHICNRRCWKHV